MKFAICNELFEGWAFHDICRAIYDIGYRGVEIAPYTLGATVGDVSKERRQEIRRQAGDQGITIVGLHWLLARLEGFQINSADADVRRKTADYLRSQIELCADIGGSLMVFGSPSARQVPPEMSHEDATKYAVDTFQQLIPTLNATGINFCLEPLSKAETNFLNTAREAEQLVEKIGSPRFKIHLDVKAMSSESMPIPDIIRAHRDQIGHFHANDPNMRGPGMGEVDFTPVFTTLREIGYPGWVSVEVFDFKPDPMTIATQSFIYMSQTSES